MRSRTSLDAMETQLHLAIKLPRRALSLLARVAREPIGLVFLSLLLWHLRVSTVGHERQRLA